MQSQVTACRFVMTSWHWNSVPVCVQYTAHYHALKWGLQQSDLALGGAYSREFFVHKPYILGKGGDFDLHSYFFKDI